MVISAAGRIVWLLDGYTVSDRFPCSTPTRGLGNYVRNAVKVTVDASTTCATPRCSRHGALLPHLAPARRTEGGAWLAARSDPPHYGKLVVYNFPKQKLIYGPRQIEARIDQDSFISQQLSLWNQRGSQVIRGNLLVIPIERSLVYVEPLYIAAEKGQLPELKRRDRRLRGSDRHGRRRWTAR